MAVDGSLAAALVIVAVDAARSFAPLAAAAVAQVFALGPPCRAAAAASPSEPPAGSTQGVASRRRFAQRARAATSGVACSTAVEVPPATAQAGPLARGGKLSFKGPPARMMLCRSELGSGAPRRQDVRSDRAARGGAQPTDLADEGGLASEYAEKHLKECGGSAACGAASRGDTDMSSAQGGDLVGLLLDGLPPLPTSASRPSASSRSL